jgi:competence CoiA-like predicted nuclease
MARFERSIKIAFDKVSGEILQADQVFESSKDAFQVRRQFHTDQIELYCCECHQKLDVSTSKYDRLHFKHQRHAGSCVLKDANLSPADIEIFTQILHGKESARHKHLKNLIADRLAVIPGIDKSSLMVDSQFIVRGEEKRRPDVYCRYHGKELVFEIQLSQLSLRYIISRYDFYRKHGMYLIWILDNFDVNDQSQLERDIKYLTHYQNFFKFDESQNGFKLACQYKSPFLSSDNEVHSKWVKYSVALDEVKFDDKEYQIFYYDYKSAMQRQLEAKELRDREFDELERVRLEQLRESELLALQRARQSEIQEKTAAIIDELKRLRQSKSQVFTRASEMLKALDAEERDHFNSTLNLSTPDAGGNPKFFQWIHSARQEDVAFLSFIFGCPFVRFDINARTIDEVSALQSVYQNSSIGKYTPVQALLKGGYNFTPADESYIRLNTVDEETEGDIILYRYCSGLKVRSYVESIFSLKKLICILHSARENKIIGFKYKASEWVAFANNAIEYYDSYWEYIELAFKHYGLWDKIITADKKGTFQKKVQLLYANMPEQSLEFDRIFRSLFPEFDNSNSLLL